MPNDVSAGRLLIDRIETGIPGLDRVLGGGLPKGRTVIITGESGTGKTVLLNSFLYYGITRFDQSCLFVTFEEPAEDIRRNVAVFGWDYPALEAAGKLAILDISPSLEQLVTVEANEHYRLDPLLEMITSRIAQLQAKRLAIDNIGSLFICFRSEAAVRGLLMQLTSRLKSLGVTTLISAERQAGRSALSEHGLEEFVAEGVIELIQGAAELRSFRCLAIRKLRGLDYQSGVVEFQISPHGIEVFPRIPLKGGVAPQLLVHRKSTGIPKLDELMLGGYPEGHVVLVTGGTGTGKTVLGLQFVHAGLQVGEPAVMLTIEETREQLLHEASTFGWDLEAAHAQKHLAFVDVPFSGMRPDQILYQIVNAVHAVGAKRLVMDSISALISGGQSQREVRLFLEQLVSFCKSEGITAVLTYAISGAFGAAAGELLGGTSITEARLSSIVDTIILLNYVERTNHVEKLLSVLKVRGSDLHAGIFRFQITNNGLEIGEQLEEHA